MAIVEGLQSWNIQITVEVEDEAAANKIFDILQDTLNDNDHTQWNAKMYRDLNMEQALEVFRKNKESILAALPDEVVEAYYPDRVAVGDDTIIDSDMNTWDEKYSHLNEEARESMKRKHKSLERHLEVVPELEEE